jgi:predicted transcriptional regulator
LKTSTINTLTVLAKAKAPMTPKEIGVAIDRSVAATSVVLVKLYDTLLVHRELKPGRGGYEYTILPAGVQALQAAKQENGLSKIKRITRG